MSENEKKAGDEYRDKMEKLWEEVKTEYKLDNTELQELVENMSEDESDAVNTWMSKLATLQSEIETKYSVHITHDEDNIEVEDI